MIRLPDGTTVPALGLGTWRLGESARQHGAEVDAVRMALDLGYRLIDTAEMYGDGGAERVVGEALARHHVPRHEVFLVSKFYPHHADPRGLREACARSLQRLGTDYLDLYLLHWPGDVPLAQTVFTLERLREAGRIRAWGVSNFDVADMAELAAVDGGLRCATNQVCYNLGARGIEFDLVPWLRERQMPVMAYSPIDQGALAGHKGLAAIAARHGATAAQVALAWVLSRGDTLAIPKAASAAHLRENFAAAALTLSDEDLTALDRLFPPPRRKVPLAVI